jgi:hypothetical protein
MTGSVFPSLSVVVEWENAKNSELPRARAMLAELASQLRRLSNRFPTPPELILVHDAGESTAVETLAAVREAVGDFPGAIEVLACDGLDYYGQKNFGASKARNAAILLADSDIIPEEDWLELLLTCLVEEDADVVCGATHLEVGDLYEKAFAAFWFFPLRSETPERRRSEHFFANNALFRAETLRRFPFPEAPLVRGNCLMLAKTLLAAGKSIYLEPAARVIHPPPNGLWHFVKRALCSGQDNVFLREDRGFRGAFRRWKAQTGAAMRRISANRREVGLRGPGVLASCFVAASYYGLEFIGDLVTQARPGLIRNHLRV